MSCQLLIMKCLCRMIVVVCLQCRCPFKIVFYVRILYFIHRIFSVFYTRQQTCKQWWISGTWFPVGFYAGSRILIRITVLFGNKTRTYTGGIPFHPAAELLSLLPYVSGKYRRNDTKLLEPIQQQDSFIPKRFTQRLNLSSFLLSHSRTYFPMLLFLAYSAQLKRNFWCQCGTTRKYVWGRNHSPYFRKTELSWLCFQKIQSN